MVAKGVWHDVNCPECGKKFETPDYLVRVGKGKYCSRSCGNSATNRTHGHTTHKSQSRTYATWATMRARCGNPNNPKYYLYGGRGISVCERWSRFENFLEDMGERPEGKTLDRIDGELGYEKSNCRWATPVEQSSNTSQVIFHDYFGERITVRELAARAGIDKRTMHWRISKWPKERWLEPRHS